MTILTWPLLDTPAAPTNPDTTQTPTTPVLRDLKCDLVTRELVIVNGDLVMVSGADAIRQDVTLALGTFVGEWFLDETVGVLDFETVFAKSPDKEAITARFKSKIAARRGVKEVTAIAVAFDGTTRKLTVTWSALTDVGLLDGSTSLER
jgi:hypothetical protein